MYAICETRQNDVLNAVRAMIKKGYRYPITQVGMKSYKKADKDRSNVPNLLEKAKDFKVNLKTETLHKAGCRVIARTKSDNLVDARIINVDKSGLKSCSVCCSD
jgi:hypothetical protein